MKRHCSTFGLLLVLGAAPAQAQEILLTGPLKAAPAGRMLWRERRLEVAAALGLRVSGAISPLPALLGELRYYPLDRVGLGVWGAAVPFFNDGCSRFCTIIAAPELVVLPVSGRSPFLGYWPYDVHLVAAPAWVWPSTGERLGPQLAASLGAGVRSFWYSSFSTSLDYRSLVGSDVAHVVSVSISWWPTQRRWDDE
jgi:hypothetical protein